MLSLSITLYLSFSFIIKTSLALTITANSTFHNSSVAASGTLTAAATLTCWNQDQDPGLGILSAFCICDETASLPEITPTPDFNNRTESCAYKTIPVSDTNCSPKELTDTLEMQPCQSCTSMGNLQGKCTSIPKCNPHVTTSSSRAPGGQSSQIVTSSKTEPSVSPSNSAMSVTSFTHSYSGPIANNGSHNGSTCLLQDVYCSLRGPGHALDGFYDDCVLWDTACTGEQSTAATKFFGDFSAITNNACFLDLSPECTTSNPAGRMSVFNDVKNYMRSPKCLLLQHSLYPDPNHSAAFQQDLYLNATCCDNCQVEADKVDVYYWPEPNADTSCQSIIGDEVSRADAGATTDDSGNVYWGCTSWLPRDEIAGTDSSTIWTTATLTSVASLQFKAYIYNPWQESPCGNITMSLSSLSNTTTGILTRLVSLHPRGHSLVATNNASTTVLGTFTL